MKAIAELFGLLFFIALVVWGTYIWTAAPTMKAVYVCAPFTYSVSGAQRVVHALEGPDVAVQTGKFGQRTMTDTATLACLNFANRWAAVGNRDLQSPSTPGAKK